ncbi:class E sortase [Luteococcus sp. Sow4_B9]|uniref:class E sortase n=1 Tax=Luteococcus sp. Sow4_B9 TaxID=3438792 RepID=UPI003F947389
MSTTTNASRGRGRRGPSPVSVIGLVLLLVGLGILGWAGWQFYGTNFTSRKAADQAATELKQDWRANSSTGKGSSAEEPSTIPGEAIALMRIPAFGADYEWPIRVGTDDGTLAKGIGWYEDTAQPGEVGNFAVAGHRVTHGEPFRRLLELEKGSVVEVETRDAIFTYQLDNAPSEITVADVDGGWVLDPVPGKPTETPTKEILTLTTCQDLFHSPDRSVAFAHLVKTDKK